MKLKMEKKETEVDNINEIVTQKINDKENITQYIKDYLKIQDI